MFTRVIGNSIRNVDSVQCFGIVNLRNTLVNGLRISRMALGRIYEWRIKARVNTCVIDTKANG